MPDKSFKAIPDFLDNAFRNFPEKIGLFFEGKEYSYRRIKENADDISNFVSNATKGGAVVALLLDNGPDFIFSYFGILDAGRTVLLIPPVISDDNFLFQIKKINPKLIISHKKFKKKFDRLQIAQNIFYTDEKREFAKIPFAKKHIPEEGISTIIFTSGATGFPKEVKLRHCNVVSATKNIIEFLKWNEKDIDVNILQLSHSFGLGNIHCVFAVAGTVALFHDAINIKEILNTIVEKKATTFAAAPSTLRLITENYYEDFKRCGKFLRFVQADTSSMENDLVKKIISALPKTDFNYYYGLTEASRSTFFSINKHLDKIGSVGKAAPNVKLKIIDGEICIKGRHVAEDSLDNGWIKTGDIGHIDEDGYLYFKTRKDDIINVSGEKVSPEEIENVVKKIPGISDAAAVSMPDKLLGEAVKLFIVVKRQDFDTQKVINECKKSLEGYKIPRAIKIIKAIPHTENGKVRRVALKNEQ